MNFFNLCLFSPKLYILFSVFCGCADILFLFLYYAWHTGTMQLFILIQLIATEVLLNFPNSESSLSGRAIIP